MTRFTLVEHLCRGADVAFGPRQRRDQRRLASADIRRILVLNAVSGLGNMVLLTGLLANLRRLYPAASITVAMPASPLAPAILTPAGAGELLFFDTTGSEHRRLLRFARRTLRPRKFDLGLATFFSATVLTARVLAAARCRFRVAYAQTKARGFLNTRTLVDHGGHELDRHLRLIEADGRPLVRTTLVRADRDATDRARARLRELGLGPPCAVVGVHPGCDRRNELKRWPLERFVAVIDALEREHMARAVVFLGPDDRDLRPALDMMLPRTVPVVDAADIDDVIALIGECRTFLTNDSGLMHVAAGLGVPVTAIFGPTDTIKNAPVGTATVLTAADVPCRPCYTAPPIRCMHERRYCLEHIGVETALAAVKQYVAAPGRVS